MGATGRGSDNQGEWTMTLLGTLFGFQGRISRITFWLCAGAVVLLDAAVLLFLQERVQAAYPTAAQLSRPSGAMLATSLPLLVIAVLSVWSGLALKVKRLHDRGRSGLYLLAGAIPVLGWLWLLWEIGLAPGTPSGARFDRDAVDDQGEPEPRAGWLAPALGGGAAVLAAPSAVTEAANISPKTSYGVIPSAEPAPQADPQPPPLPEVETVAAAPAEPEPSSVPEPVIPAPDEPTPDETQAQIAAYLESVGHLEPEASDMAAEEPPVLSPS
jgi:uncharacterized membrane protein YhaH (DUF805 family)